MMQESTNKLLSFRLEQVITVSVHLVTITSSGPSFRVHRKVESLVPSAIIDTQSLQSNYRDTFSLVFIQTLNTKPSVGIEDIKSTSNS